MLGGHLSMTLIEVMCLDEESRLLLVSVCEIGLEVGLSVIKRTSHHEAVGWVRLVEVGLWLKVSLVRGYEVKYDNKVNKYQFLVKY